MHGKTGVVDGVWSTIGSYNFDARSFFYNLEVVAEVLDPELGAVMEAQFAIDAANCDVYDESVWLALPWWKKALAWVAFRLRHYL
jgi:cardiolipin synthase